MSYIEYNSQKFLYLQVPRTGSGSIVTWMETLAPLRFHAVSTPACLWSAPRYLRMSDFVDLFGDKYFDYAFMTVRNPYNRLMSEYKRIARSEVGGFWQAYPTLSHWLEVVIKQSHENPSRPDSYLRPQWEFIGTGVEYIKFEHTIPSIIHHMAIRMGVTDVKLPPDPRSTSDFEPPVFLDRFDRLRIQEFYCNDFGVFDYDINDYGSTRDNV